MINWRKCHASILDKLFFRKVRGALSHSSTPTQTDKPLLGRWSIVASCLYDTKLKATNRRVLWILQDIWGVNTIALVATWGWNLCYY